MNRPYCHAEAIIDGINSISNEIIDEFNEMKAHMICQRIKNKSIYIAIPAIAASLIFIVSIVLYQNNKNAITPNDALSTSSSSNDYQNEESNSSDSSSVNNANEKNNIIYLDNKLYDSEIYLSATKGMAGYGIIIGSKIETKSLSEDALYAIQIVATSEEYEAYIRKKTADLDDLYFNHLFKEINKSIEEAEQADNIDRKKELEEKKGELWKKYVIELHSIVNDADNIQIGLMNSIEKDFNISIKRKIINFGYDGKVVEQSMYYITYLTGKQIYTLVSHDLTEKEYGFEFDFAPEFVDWDDEVIDLRDPLFCNISE